MSEAPIITIDGCRFVDAGFHAVEVAALRSRLAEVAEDRDLERMRADGNQEMLRDADERLSAAEALLREAGEPVRELLWCLTVWNDHNFTEQDLIRKLTKARIALGLDGVDRVDKANDQLSRIDAFLAEKQGITVAEVPYP